MDSPVYIHVSLISLESVRMGSVTFIGSDWRRKLAKKDQLLKNNDVKLP